MNKMNKTPTPHAPLSQAKSRSLEQMQDDYAEWRKIYSRSVVESRADLQREESAILAAIKTAKLASN